MPVGKVWHYPHFVELFHTSTHLGSVELSKEWQRVHDWGKVWHYPYFVRLFLTSTPLRSVELRMKKESRDLVASTGHLWDWRAYLLAPPASGDTITDCCQSRICSLIHFNTAGSAYKLSTGMSKKPWNGKKDIDQNFAGSIRYIHLCLKSVW